MAERLIGDRRTSDSSPTEERNHPIPPPTKTYRPASPLLGSTSGPRSQPACRSWANPDGRSGSKAAQRPTQTAIRAHQDKWQQAGVSASWVAGDEIYGTDPGCGPSCRPARSAMCWRSPATTGSAGVASPAGSRGRSGGSRPGRGRVGRLERAPRATACPTGRLRAWTTMVLHQPTRPDATDCWSAGTAPPASWPSTAAARLARPRWRFWSRSPGGAGPSKSASRPARACAAWTSTRSAAGTPGPAG
jgi:hypothetical protein